MCFDVIEKFLCPVNARPNSHSSLPRPGQTPPFSSPMFPLLSAILLAIAGERWLDLLAIEIPSICENTSDRNTPMYFRNVPNHSMYFYYEIIIHSYSYYVKNRIRTFVENISIAGTRIFKTLGSASFYQNARYKIISPPFDHHDHPLRKSRNHHRSQRLHQGTSSLPPSCATPVHFSCFRVRCRPSH